MSKNKKQMIKNLSNIFKLTLICALILDTKSANAENDDTLLIVKGYEIRYFASTADFYPRASNLQSYSPVETFTLGKWHFENIKHLKSTKI